MPENVTSERPIALMPTLIRWCEALRAPEVAKWQQKYRVECDATDGRNGGAQRTAWEVLIEMERFSGKAKAEDQGAVSLVRDLAKAFERVSPSVMEKGAQKQEIQNEKVWRRLLGKKFLLVQRIPASNASREEEEEEEEMKQQQRMVIMRDPIRKKQIKRENGR